MKLIDTHAHLDDNRFRDDLPEVLDRARSIGLTRIVTVATTAASSQTCIELARRHPMLRATLGIQPNHVAEEPADAWDQVLALATAPGVVALGETGLDRYWKHTPFDMQEDFFARHLELSRKLGLPVVIHCREAEADVVRMLRDDFERHGPVSGVMHSFTGGPETMQACVDMGLYVSFAGMLTYKNADALRAVAKQVPLDRLLVETDSPYLAPVPVRGKRNEPSNVRYTTECLANIRGITLEQVAERTTQNADALFGIK